MLWAPPALPWPTYLLFKAKCNWRSRKNGPYNCLVSDMLYDVFVVGAKDPSPVAQMHLSADLAKHFQAPVADVAQAIATRNLRAGKSLDEAQSRILCQQLANLGAITELRPTVQGAGRTRVSASTQERAAVGSGDTRAPSLATLVSTPGTDMVGRDPFATQINVPATIVNPALRASGTYASATAAAPLGRLAPGTVADGSAFRPPAGGPAATTSGARNPFSAPDDGSPRLELARPAPAGNRAVGETAEVPRVRPNLPGTSGMNHMRLATDSALSGVEVAGDQSKSHMLRCAKHGLYYDQRTSSGCRKCMEPAKQLARKIEGHAMGSRLMALRDNPAKRAGWGLTFALALGFLPAAWHALAFGRPEVQSLRAEQAVLSNKVGTEEVIRRYHALDQHVHDVHSKHRRNTAIVWVVIAGGALVAWYRLT